MEMKHQDGEEGVVYVEVGSWTLEWLVLREKA